MKKLNQSGNSSIPDDVRLKLEKLHSILRDMKKVVVAFSGGVDSSFLLKVAHDVLKEDVTAVTLHSEVISEKELNEAKKIALTLKVKHEIINHCALDNPEFVKNSELRCYYCKKDEFAEIKEYASKCGYFYVLDGSNSDDEQDYRPGSKALKELDIRSPLKEARLTKQEIRLLSKAMMLSTWDKPAMACLASRFPYNTKIDRKNLERIARAEEFLQDLGFIQVRVRHHENIARIEVLPIHLKKLLDNSTRKKIVSFFKKTGYTYVTFDLQGYRMGSLNEELDRSKLKKSS